MGVPEYIDVNAGQLKRSKRERIMEEKDIRELEKRGYDLKKLGVDKSKVSKRSNAKESMSLDDMRIAIRKNTNWRMFQQLLLVISIVSSIISIILVIH